MFDEEYNFRNLYNGRGGRQINSQVVEKTMRKHQMRNHIGVWKCDEKPYWNRLHYGQRKHSEDTPKEKMFEMMMTIMLDCSTWKCRNCSATCTMDGGYKESSSWKHNEKTPDEKPKLRCENLMRNHIEMWKHTLVYALPQLMTIMLDCRSKKCKDYITVKENRAKTL